MKLARLSIGILLVGLAVFVIVGEQLAGTSANAFLNARLSTIRAPIAGRVSLDTPVLGIRVRKGQELGQLNDPLVDNAVVSALLGERAKVDIEVTRLQTALTAVREAIARLNDRALLYHDHRLRQLRAELGAFNAAQQVAQAQLALNRQTLTRISRLSSTGIETTSALEQAQSQVEIAEREVEKAKAQSSALQIGLEAGHRGVFLGDGYNDAPYSEQRISELRWQEDEMAASLTAQTAMRDALSRRIDAERLRVNRLTHSALTSTVNGILWSLQTADGETVQRGENLIQLVDCDSMIVTLSVTERTYNTLRLGQSASFRPTGTSTIFDGVVIRLAGSGAATIYDNLAVAPSPQHLERYDVAISVPALLSDNRLRCAIGRTGRVFFEARPLDWLRDLWR